MRNINKRIDPNIMISEDLFSSSLIDVTDFLCFNLKGFLEKEGRYLGIVKSYTNSMDNAYERFNKDLEDEDIEVFGRTLYLLKPILVREFLRLKNKKLSEGDCIILMIRKILQIVQENPDYSHRREAKTLLKIINSMYDNIKNRNKKDSMYNFSNTIKNLKQVGAVGKYSIDTLELISEKKEKEVYQGDGLLLESESESKISEQTLWTENQ